MAAVWRLPGSKKPVPVAGAAHRSALVYVLVVPAQDRYTHSQ